MTSFSITDAIPILEELSTLLDKTYWEANSMNTKDIVYDCISAIHTELSELNKLSIQDHDMAYEPISADFKMATNRLSTFRKYLDNHIMRTSTLHKLDHSISSVIKLLSPNENTK